jgi:fidgetin-like protein 1
MMRNKAVSSMQKTYDECYLACSTAVYFEGQNNEAEALRSWKNALDQIYFHNYKLPSNYTPKSETEKALFASLKQLELQCRERVDLLEALRQSRRESGTEEDKPEKEGRRKRLEKEKGKGNSVDSFAEPSSSQPPSAWLGDGSVPPLDYADLPNASPALPPRPAVTLTKSNIVDKERASSVPQIYTPPLGPPPTLPVPSKQTSRSPSPDYGRKTMRTTLRPERKGFRSSRSAQQVPRRQAPMKAAGLAWDTKASTSSLSLNRPESDPTIEARLSATAARRSLDMSSTRNDDLVRMPSAQDYISSPIRPTVSDIDRPSKLYPSMDNLSIEAQDGGDRDDLETPPPPPPHSNNISPVVSRTRPRSPPRLPKPPEIKYHREYPPQKSNVPDPVANSILEKAYQSKSGITRKPVASQQSPSSAHHPATSESESETLKRTPEGPTRRTAPPRKTSGRKPAKPITPPSTSPSPSLPSDSEDHEPQEDDPETAFDKRSAHLLAHLPRGLDPTAARAILNEIIIRGDEVHWSDVAGLEPAKTALKEAVVYPFLRPDLFLGLREPARGMLLFGPPGTGKTMLARAVATESKSTFFAISASSLTSKWHGESEKLVRALFGIAKRMSPSIIFVDEIDSLLGKRGEGSEHEASRRAKTEFLIQWSDLQRAAAGRETTKRKAPIERGEESIEEDASRVLVLAATNVPWDIDEAARRRFVRRQYIPLPEGGTREKQLRTLLERQKCDLTEEDIERLVALTDGKLHS